MLDISAAIPIISKKLKDLPVGDGLDLRTYKRDRSLVILKSSDTEYRIIEEGFAKQEFVIPAEKLGKTMKTLLKKEFPRSNKVRVTVLTAGSI